MTRLSRDPITAVLISLLLCLTVVNCGSRPADQAGQTSEKARPGREPVGSAGPRILTNQVGYEPLGAKKAVIQASSGDLFGSFTVKGWPGGNEVLTGTPRHDGLVHNWKDWDFWTIDWSAVTAEGAYIIEVSRSLGRSKASSSSSTSPASNDPSSVSSRPLFRSHPILVQRNALERNTLSDVIYYFKGQRSSGLWDKADRAIAFEGRAGTVDMHGGWFDATGDYGKHLSHLSYSTYFNPQQVSLTAWSLFMTLRELERRDEPAFKQYRKRLLDEALFGADYLVRSKDPNGSFYITVSGRGPEKKPEDRRIAAKAERHIILTPETKDKFRDYGRERIAGDAAYEAGWREGAGLSIAALAMAAARGGKDGAPGREGYGVSRGEGDFGQADYLRAAEACFAFLEKNNLLLTNDGKENILDDYCALIAASELFRTTKKQVYLEVANRRATSIEARLTTGTAGAKGDASVSGDGSGTAGKASGGATSYKDYWRADDGDRPFFHPVDAGLPVISLLMYAEIADASNRAKALDTVRRSLVFELGVTAEVTNPFGYSRQLVQSKDGMATRRTAFFFPHDTETAPWWQGENARLGSMAAAARMAARALGADSKTGSGIGGAAADPAFADKVKVLGRDQLNWLLGLNPYDACMLHGHGRNNIPYMFFDSYEYTNAPGGICNGITGGYAEGDADGIDFGLHYAQTGKDDDWRWAEQWLPHAAWYLLAISIGD
jgi:Glycosyl hydrolase family 9/Cellulase N-terminal ig-like domain